VLLCSPGIRFQMRKLLEGSFSNLTILSYGEIPGVLNIKASGTVVVHESENISGG
jgi:flagellar biosynthesis component FlhA